MKRATFRLLYRASGTSGRRTAFLRLGKVFLLINERVYWPLLFYNKMMHRACSLVVSTMFCYALLLTVARSIIGLPSMSGKSK